MRNLALALLVVMEHFLAAPLAAHTRFIHAYSGTGRA